jgi:hypothetical protein
MDQLPLREKYALIHLSAILLTSNKNFKLEE